MGAIFAYSIATGVMLTLLYLIARLALGRQTFHALSRWSLLASLAISIMVPGLLTIDYKAAPSTVIETSDQLIGAPVI
ncbi:MAG: hypothetical protein K2M05_08515, partial [Paramuribaculum sp.]|nr:hypothetical protein [Paramuribaculum sp.]